MDRFRSRVRSGFKLDIHNSNAITAHKVQFTFHYYASSSLWGWDGEDQVCVLYFGFDIHEKSEKCEIQSAEVKLDFSGSGTSIELMSVAPEKEIRQTSEREYIERFSFNPSADTPFGGGSLGGIERERIFDGLPDWRFRGVLDVPSPTTSATWAWIRGAHYDKARGVPRMEVGVVGKGCANVPFKGTVTMNLVPRGFWRKVLNENEKAFLVQFNPVGQGDLSAIVANFEALIQRKMEAIMT
ncbi:hypothetical protein F5144DRAFT_560006 [Chaetomium tenue]|uniref:Uncharacterized protein n=1 Tax=Chaetomium tenue TaxID=1854479 RepID=A0ACB7PFN8_9PEZI|nr:hypothetical protein F5144DRAFT_560006 [Chaetomium globosum]